MYSDDLLVFRKSPLMILRGLEALFSLKGVGRPDFYLGGDVNIVKTKKGERYASLARIYIKNVCKKIEKLFEVYLKNY